MAEVLAVDSVDDVAAGLAVDLAGVAVRRGGARAE